MQFQESFFFGAKLVPPGTVLSTAKFWRERFSIYMSVGPFDGEPIEELWIKASTVIGGKLYIFASLPPNFSIDDDDEYVWLFEIVSNDSVKLVFPEDVDGLKGCALARNDVDTLQEFLGVIPTRTDFST
ncbi:MAG: hypothetical protein K2X93_00695 [Candidatus Obscuribacterales bacterium]|nr:hypothetical protein [Candidatus Obscuribacterales bacterium]